MADQKVSSSTSTTEKDGLIHENVQNGSQQSGAQTSGVWTPAIQALMDRATATAANTNVRGYQVAQWNPATQQGFQTLQQGRDQSGIRSVLSGYQNQASSLANAATDIAGMTESFRNRAGEATAKSQLQSDIQSQLGKDIGQLNRNAVGRGNTASSRTAITEALTRQGAMDSYAKGAAAIESNAYNTATQLASNVWGQQQSIMGQNLAAQGAIQQNLANWNQADAQTAVNAGLAMTAQEQKNIDVGRTNATIADNQDLARLSGLTGTLGQMSGWQIANTQNNMGTVNRTSNETQSGTVTNTMYQPEQNSGGLTWGGLASSVGGAIANKAASAVADKAGSWIASWL